MGQQQPWGQQQFGGEQFPGQQFLNDPMANMAMQYGTSLAGQGKDMVHKNVSTLTYFDYLCTLTYFDYLCTLTYFDYLCTLTYFDYLCTLTYFDYQRCFVCCVAALKSPPTLSFNALIIPILGIVCKISFHYSCPWISSMSFIAFKMS